MFGHFLRLTWSHGRLLQLLGLTEPVDLKLRRTPSVRKVSFQVKRSFFVSVANVILKVSSQRNKTDLNVTIYGYFDRTSSPRQHSWQ